VSSKTSNRAIDPFLAPPSKRVKLAAQCSRRRIEFVRLYSFVERLIIGAPGKAGRRSLRAVRWAAVMKWTILLTGLVVSACDPSVVVGFMVSTSVDDSTAELSTQIAHAIAQRHGMSAQHLDSSCDLASYHSSMGPTSVDLCVDQKPQSVSLWLSELITDHWGAKGDSVRRELEDSLRTRFRDRVTRID